MDAHTEYPADYLKLGVERLARGGTRWVSGPQVPAGRGRVSRAVGLALRTPLGRGGSRKWAAAGTAPTTSTTWTPGSSPECGRRDALAVRRVGRTWLRNQDAEMAGRFLGRGESLVCLPQMGGGYAPRDSIRRLGGNIGNTASSGSRRRSSSAHHATIASDCAGARRDRGRRDCRAASGASRGSRWSGRVRRRAPGCGHSGRRRPIHPRMLRWCRWRSARCTSATGGRDPRRRPQRRTGRGAGDRAGLPPARSQAQSSS